MLHTIMAQKLLPVMAGGDQSGGIFGKEGLGVGIKGDGSGLTVELPGQIPALRQQRLMAGVYTIEKTQCVNSFFVCHNFTKFKFQFIALFDGCA